MSATPAERLNGGFGIQPLALRAKELEEQLKQCQNGVMLAFNMMLDLKDLKTGLHATRLAEWAARVAEHLGVGYEELRDVELPVLRPIVAQWFAGIPTQRPFTDVWSQVCHAWERVRHPAGTDPVVEAMKQAETADLPAEAERLGYGDDEPTRRLLLLCRELGGRSGGRFFLSGSKASKVVGGLSPAWAYKRLEMFVGDGFLRRLKRGNQFIATRWRWINKGQES